MYAGIGTVGSKGLFIIVRDSTCVLDIGVKLFQ